MAVATTRRRPLGRRACWTACGRWPDNLWWAWNADAQALFASMDPTLYVATNQNPVKTLRMLSPERRDALEEDPRFAGAPGSGGEGAEGVPGGEDVVREEGGEGAAGDRVLLGGVRGARVAAAVLGRTGGAGGRPPEERVGPGVPLVAVGLLYRNGFYTQEFKADGSTRVIYPQLDFADYPMTDTGKVIAVPMGGKTIKAKVWREVVGRVQLYLLDTDVAGNTPADRELTSHLYGGGPGVPDPAGDPAGHRRGARAGRAGRPADGVAHERGARGVQLRWSDRGARLKGAARRSTRRSSAVSGGRRSSRRTRRCRRGTTASRRTLVMKYFGNVRRALGCRGGVPGAGREDVANKAEDSA